MSLPNFRTWAYDNSPTWLKGFWGSRAVYTMHVPIDSEGDALKSSFAHATVGAGDSESLSQLAQDRGLSRGYFQSEESFAEDVTKAFDGWKRAGSAGELARRLCRVVYNGTPSYVKVMRVADSSGLTGVSYQVESPYEEAVKVVGGPLQFNWDGQLANWSRLVVLVDMSTFPGGAAPRKLGDGHRLGDGTRLGTTAPREVTDALITECRKWSAEHTRFIALHLDYQGTADGAGATDLQQGFATNWQGGSSWSCMQSGMQQPIGFYWGGAWLSVEPRGGAV